MRDRRTTMLNNRGALLSGIAAGRKLPSHVLKRLVVAHKCGGPTGITYVLKMYWPEKRVTLLRQCLIFYWAVSNLLKSGRGQVFHQSPLIITSRSWINWSTSWWKQTFYPICERVGALLCHPLQVFFYRAPTHPGFCLVHIFTINLQVSITAQHCR